MRSRKRDVVCGLIWSSDEKLLLGKRPDSSNSTFPGCWHAPGGGVEAGETLLEALDREMREEIGISVIEFNPTLIDDCGGAVTNKTAADGAHEVVTMRFFVYDVRIPKPASDIALVQADEFEFLLWYSKSELAALTLVPAGVALFKRLKLL